MDTVTVVGNGAVGTAVAVALSAKYRVILAGPPGTMETCSRFTLSGDYTYQTRLHRISVNKAQESFAVVTALKAYDIRASVEHIKKICSGPILCMSNGMGLESEWGCLAGRVEYSVLTMGFRLSTETDVLSSRGTIYSLNGGQAEKLFTGTVLGTKSVDCLDGARRVWHIV